MDCKTSGGVCVFVVFVVFVVYVVYVVYVVTWWMRL